ncbi:unnamed protein product [Polarella glacialis]|uniref:Uncharacterized protein n=1 Tax=Polarella glacialis TaxID=89957 RepID=A0A813GWT1_POLGL|nr:unnamed protein product [Polarella glacialis]CAE8629307.1 unnamed protein product [Polarella glacialis]CAE8642481.1 unnamed protein product [Polarella glacialis]
MPILTEPVDSVADLKEVVLDLHPHLDFYSMAIYDSQGDLVDEADSVSIMEIYTIEDLPAVPPSVGHIGDELLPCFANPENVHIEDQPAAAHDKEPKGDQPDDHQAPMMAPRHRRRPATKYVFDPYNDPAAMEAASLMHERNYHDHHIDVGPHH